jgi:hypothetical protein
MEKRRYIVEQSEMNDDYRSKLTIIVDNEVSNEFWDGGEPEDNYFFRDWGWVASELERAYKLGFEHGKEWEFQNSSRGF